MTASTILITARNINQQQQQNINQFISPPPTPFIRETSSGTALDETEENNSLIKKTLTKKKTTSYQTATLHWSKQEKSRRTPSIACLPSTYLFQWLKVVLMWNCLLS